MRLIDADDLREQAIEVLENIRKNPKMDKQEMHIVGASNMICQMIDDAPTIDIEGEKSLAYHAGFEEGYNAGLSAGAGGIVVCG